MLDAWEFSDTNFLSVFGYAPKSLTNVSFVSTWAGSSLQVDDTNAAWIIYPGVEPDGHTNLDIRQGTVSMWFSPDWNSSDGLGAWGTIFAVGDWNTNLTSASGAWGLYISPDASSLYFSAQTSVVATNYLSAPISWNAGEWHQITLTYSATNSALYLEGQMVTNGPGVTVVPGADTLTNGFSIGSDGFGTGLRQSRAVYNDFFAYNYQLDADTILNSYAYDSQSVYPLPSSGGHFTLDSPPSPSGLGTNGGSGGGSTTYSPSYTSNQFWLQALPLGTNAYNANTNCITLMLHGTVADTAYQILSTTNLPTDPTNWIVETNLIGSASTNFTVTAITMTGRPTLFFRAFANTLDSDGDGLPDWWELKYSTGSFPLSPTNADTGNTGIPDGYKQDSAGDGYNNLQKYQMGIAPNVFVTPPAPVNFTVILNTNGTATLSWNQSSGSVIGYVISRADPTPYGYLGDLQGYQPIATNSAGNLSFTDAGAFTVGDPLNSFLQGSVYEVQALYAGGLSQAGVSRMLGDQSTPDYAVNAKLVRGPYGRWQLVFSALPAAVQSLQINYQFYDFWEDAAYDYGNNQTISTSDLVNNVYQIPDAVITNYTGYNQWIQYAGGDSGFDSSLNFDGDWAYIVNVQGVSASGAYGPNTPAGLITQDACYFMDGRPHLQESLAFLLQGAGQSQPYSLANEGVFQYFFGTQGTNFIEHSFIHPALSNKGYGITNIGPTPYLAVDNTWPLVVDYQLAQWLYSSNSTPVFSWSQDFNPDPLPPVLGHNGSYQNGPYWIAQDVGHLADLGVSGDDSSVTLAGGIHNLYGLPVQTALVYVDGIDPNTGLPIGFSGDYDLSPGSSGSFSLSYVYQYWSQFTAPSNQTAGYYFAPVNSPGMDVMGLNSPVQNYSLPLTADFAVTNESPLALGAVGQPLVLGGWAKQAITNGTAGMYAYLGQYFQTNAYKISNGIVTTNVTGILSPYGEFFPTDPGPVALMTMPDYTTGQVGTNVVNVIKLQVDASGDGVMNPSFAGPDNPSANHPYKMWINNDCDAAANALGPDEDIDSPNTPDFASGIINSQRDLEDYARLWIMGVPALTNGSYQVKLSWTNIVSGNPSIELFNSVETNGGTGYLTDTNIAAAQINVVNYSGVSIGTVTNGSTFIFPTNYFTNNATKYLLFEGASVGNGQLVLTISQNGTNLVSTSTYMNLMDVKDMFEHAHITGITNALPGTSFMASSYFEDNILPTNPTEDTNLVLFVHGWRMGQWDYENFSETMFKRLYWQGFHGRFLSVRWPTLSQDDFWLPALDYTTYNSSEFNAWKSGSGLSAYLTHLKQRFPNYNLNVCAHSMGNVVMAEALKDQLALGQQNVANYVLMQAAVPASCYDTSFTNYAPFLAAEASEATPNTYQGYPGAINNAITGQMVDFYNTNDYALATGTLNILGVVVGINWEANQENFKPDSGLGYRDSSNGSNSYNGFVDVIDNREIMAFCARPRSKAVGAQAGVAGVIQISKQVNLSSPAYNFQNGSDQHSAQFNWDIQKVSNFYNILLTILIPTE